MTKAGEGIMNGINDALAYVRGDKSRARTTIIDTSVNVKKIRSKTGMTQERFAATFRLSLSTLKKWETGVREPEGAAKAYLTVISQHPDIVKKALKNASVNA